MDEAPPTTDPIVNCAAIGCNPCDFVNYRDLWPVDQSPPEEAVILACTPVPEAISNPVTTEPVVVRVDPLPRTGFEGSLALVGALLIAVGMRAMRGARCPG